jgi:bifunctional UDP-N-acetylglucosamine pyrophosphorylase/glucosamine-1-phosphate N-acetyltransferase
MTDTGQLAIILAAGEGTRMKSSTPKVAHEIAGRAMVGHVMEAVRGAGLTRLAVVIGPDRADVAGIIAKQAPGTVVVEQRERRGTAHAVLMARDEIASGCGVAIVLFADTPLVRPETIRLLGDAVQAGAAVAALGFRAADPTGYGRFITGSEGLLAIREHKDATDAERRINLCNAGLMALSGARALEILDAIGSNNAQNEFYLTDAVEVARSLGLTAVAVEASEEEVMGVNDRVQLSQAEAIMQRRLREAAMRGGVTLQDPHTVRFCYDTRLGRDVVVEPNVFFGPGVEVGDGAVIHAFSHLEGASVGAKATVGPFARLRPGAALGPDSKVGNFVEIKNADLARGAKVSHLTYIGDASIGANANIGAGTITCNYDGYFKHRTVIGEGAFVGSNSALVAPVRIGEGAYVGSGSVVTADVPDGALALARARQEVKPGWADRYNKAMAERKRTQRKGD